MPVERKNKYHLTGTPIKINQASNEWRNVKRIYIYLYMHNNYLYSLTVKTVLKNK